MTMIECSKSKQFGCNIIHKSITFIFFSALLITHGFILEFLRFRTPDLCSRLFFLNRYSLSHFLQKILHYSLFFSYLKNNEPFRSRYARYLYSPLPCRSDPSQRPASGWEGIKGRVFRNYHQSPSPYPYPYPINGEGMIGTRSIMREKLETQSSRILMRFPCPPAK